MAKTIEQIVEYIRNHRCYTHPIFKNWAVVEPTPEVVGALFHQIQSFCASTRPGWNFPKALENLGLQGESTLLQEIVDSEANHGPELATMAGFILNCAAKGNICSDLYNQAAVEGKLKEYSDQLLSSLPGYDPKTGLTIQTRKAIAVFVRRKLTDRESTFHNLGVALALEIISNCQLIPGEKHCLIDSGLYGANMDYSEMHYLLEHWGEIGAEQQHEKNAIAAVASILNEETEPLIMEGVNDFLNSLADLWDLLNTALLQSGNKRVTREIAQVA
ncbi:MAG: hypothetical protein KME31_03885 [Tolypothrix carrinoi HA7290-LM1]|jgi:hypothetical protein|nr:hypothetical protein [Tolypothrix carrinoi HA7290-LM1]